MKHLSFSKASFVKSAADIEGFPPSMLPEIALIGRSNVGKSSLINHLLNHSKLAKVSNTPGKTQLLNFFTVDDSLMLVDLPGYGYAKVARTTIAKWSAAIDDYLEKRSQLKLLLVLLDLNRLPNSDDLQFIEWAHHFKKPMLIVFTKSDKLNQKEKNEQQKKNCEAIAEICGDDVLPFVTYSIKNGRARTALMTKLNDLIK
ncbi:MAG: YihA family ribosome biogenesis GTP-binding protein [Chlamydiales bacterium]|nr:YihA family ribosome biogenesis GTP-binding protein [Chlamydiales bacterium]